MTDLRVAADHPRRAMWAAPRPSYRRPMSTIEPGRARFSTRTDRPPEGVFLGADTAPSWITFAGMILGLVAVMNLIYGIAAIGDSTFFVGDTKFVLSNLDFWGWILILVAIVQGSAAIGVFARTQVACWAGVAITFVAISIMAFFVDVIVIWGLLMYGGRDRYSLAG
jgi:hypothetical protein